MDEDLYTSVYVWLKLSVIKRYGNASRHKYDDLMSYIVLFRSCSRGQLCVAVTAAHPVV